MLPFFYRFFLSLYLYILYINIVIGKLSSVTISNYTDFYTPSSASLIPSILTILFFHALYYLLISTNSSLFYFSPSPFSSREECTATHCASVSARCNVVCVWATGGRARGRWVPSWGRRQGPKQCQVRRWANIDSLNTEQTMDTEETIVKQGSTKRLVNNRETWLWSKRTAYNFKKWAAKTTGKCVGYMHDLSA